MSTKKQLKAELQLESVAFINNLLKAAGRNKETLRSPEISEADELLIHLAIPHLKSGKSPTESIKLAEAEIRGTQQAESTEPTSALTSQTTESRHSLTAQKREQIVFEQAIQIGTELAEKAEILKWAAYAAAISSDQVQNSDRVVQAREFALSLNDGGLANDSHLHFLNEYLDQVGFFQPVLTGVGHAPVMAIEAGETNSSGSADY